ncbi:hypothetical protein [Aestuariibaculum sediminum]|uniref:Uncharacterized protein n=1 Tax=Aestuariibaculum sediminum TaxID=2770637 RepID=A0A8J6U7Y5_9FLAO|nr:hypothetical protein [Aestuariibaculum sediminum]MBD0830567.1 hypothetical protein [Aestuariibaculum sediminum]
MKHLTNISKLVALLSFVFGTLLLSTYLYFGRSEQLLFIGLKYVLLAIAINSILLFANLLATIPASSNRLEHLKTCGIILLNIPIACLYIYIVIQFKITPNF